jgi:hypothetical protein
MAERCTVDANVVGSSPISHPVFFLLSGYSDVKEQSYVYDRELLNSTPLGLVKATANEVIVSITAITEKGKPISRSSCKSI